MQRMVRDYVDMIQGNRHNPEYLSKILTEYEGCQLIKELAGYLDSVRMSIDEIEREEFFKKYPTKYDDFDMEKFRRELRLEDPEYAC